MSTKKHPLTIEDIEARCKSVGDCLEWQGPYSTNGYPIITHGKKLKAHLRKVAFNLRCGNADDDNSIEVGRGLKLIMTCNNRRCLAGEHMRLLPESMVQKKAADRGAYSTPSRRAAVTAGVRSKRTNLKLTMDKAREIRADPRPQHVKAKVYGVSLSLVGRIERHQTWAETMSGASVFNMGT